jgi:hypothetical protein
MFNVFVYTQYLLCSEDRIAMFITMITENRKKNKYVIVYRNLKFFMQLQHL